MSEKRKRRKVMNRVRLVLGGISVNGAKATADLNYERIEYDDGTVRERGKPDGWPKNMTPGEIIQRHFLLGSK